jgi:hypothetical protein
MRATPGKLGSSRVLYDRGSGLVLGGQPSGAVVMRL